MSAHEPPVPEPEELAVEAAVEEEEPRARIERFVALVEERDEAGLAEFIAELHAPDVADLVEALDEDGRIWVMERLPIEVASETLTEMEYEEHPEELLVALDTDRIAELIGELSDDDAVDLIRELEPTEQARVLATLPHLDAAQLRRLLQYDEESAGGIMTTELVAVSVHSTAADAIAQVRRQAQEIGVDFYTIFVVDAYRRLIGTVSLQDLVIADPETPVTQLVQEPMATVTVDEDQEEVGRLIGRYNLPSIAVVGPNDLLLGRITWDDVIDVMELEQTEDILHLAGVGSEEEVRGGWWNSVKSRLPWLYVNMFTAFIAALVVRAFEGTIEQMAFLAAINPVIAGLGGNAATQTLAVTVRRLALTDDGVTQRWDVASKELFVGLFNGMMLGIVAGIAAWLWLDQPMLGVVVLIAMWGNLVVASAAGAFVPLLLDRWGADPAVASSIFVTAFTDTMGFFLFLGLATQLLL